MQQSTGLTLLEVMISLCILSIAMLGFDVLQIAAMRQAKALFYGTIARQQVKMIEELLMSAGENNSTDYIELWKKQNTEVLPRGRGQITGAYPQYGISIFWGGLSEGQCLQSTIGVQGCLREKIIL